jgi:hypothetical protein
MATINVQEQTARKLENPQLLILKSFGFFPLNLMALQIARLPLLILLDV